MVRANGGDVDIDVAVVVIVADGAPEAVHFNREACLARDIGESSVSIVVIEGREGFARLVPGPVHRINQQNILPAVIVVVEKAGAAAHGLGKIFLSERAAVVFEVNTGLGGYVGELDGTGRTGGIRGRFRGWGRRLRGGG